MNYPPDLDTEVAKEIPHRDDLAFFFISLAMQVLVTIASIFATPANSASTVIARCSLYIFFILALASISYSAHDNDGAGDGRIRVAGFLVILIATVTTIELTDFRHRGPQLHNWVTYFIIAASYVAGLCALAWYFDADTLNANDVLPLLDDEQRLRLPDWLIIILSLGSSLIVLGCYVFDYLSVLVPLTIVMFVYKVRIVLAVLLYLISTSRVLMNLHLLTAPLLEYLSRKRDGLVKWSYKTFRLQRDSKNADAHLIYLFCLTLLVATYTSVAYILIGCTYLVWSIAWVSSYLSSLLINSLRSLFFNLFSGPMIYSVMISLAVLTFVCFVKLVPVLLLAIPAELANTHSGALRVMLILGWSLLALFCNGLATVGMSSIRLRCFEQRFVAFAALLLATFWLIVLMLQILAFGNVPVVRDYQFELNVSVWNAVSFVVVVAVALKALNKSEWN